MQCEVGPIRPAPGSNRMGDGVVVVGAGPAGLAAALELVRRGIRPIVLEASATVGGLARTEVYRGHRFDIGGHRFYTRIPEIHRLWQEMLGDEFLVVRRLSRIYSGGRFFKYPLEPFDAVLRIGLVESSRILLSYLGAQLRPHRRAETLEQWVINRFGRRLYETFFKSYTEKVWGLPCNSIGADWAAQRIRTLSLYRALANAVFGNHRSDSLIHEFHYPARGPGRMWERIREVVESSGGRVELCSPVVRVRHERGAVHTVTVGGHGSSRDIACDHVVSTMAIGDLVHQLDPAPPPEALHAASGLRHRALVVVGLIVGREQLFPDQWIYVHEPGVRVGRIQNFKNWSAEMCGAAGTSNLGLEYFCDKGDETWSLPDVELVRLASRELAVLGLARPPDVIDGVVFRQSKAYPVYDHGYQERLAVIRENLATIRNLHTIGRSGMHRYNNQDHSMVTGQRAVDHLFGKPSDLWGINTERAHNEGSVMRGPLSRATVHRSSVG